MKKATFQLETLTCPSCINKIENVLGRERGVQEAKVLFHSSKVKVQFDENMTSADKLQNTMAKLGYPVQSAKVS